MVLHVRRTVFSTPINQGDHHGFVFIYWRFNENATIRQNLEAWEKIKRLSPGRREDLLKPKDSDQNQLSMPAVMVILIEGIIPHEIDTEILKARIKTLRKIHELESDKISDEIMRCIQRIEDKL